MEDFREEFLVLGRQVHGRRLVYLDNAATTLKPRRVVEAMDRYYNERSANVHRGVHLLSQEATREYEAVRERVRKFINAKSEKEIIFTSGATDSLNLLASVFCEARMEALGGGSAYLQEGDEIIVSEMEHHSNLLPWLFLQERYGVIVKVVGIDAAGDLDWAEYKKHLSERTKLVCMVWVSNALGTINSMGEIVAAAHGYGALVVADAAQALGHFPIDVQEAGVDFLAASAHKAFGPTGVGVLYGREKLLEELPPYRSGGEMVLRVSLKSGILLKSLPQRFEAGTPNIAGVIGFGAALAFINEIGFAFIQEREKELLRVAEEAFRSLKKIRFLGAAKKKVPIFSFVLEGVHAHDVGTICDEEGVAVRTGHHCTQPIMERYGVPATARASLAFYNSQADLERLVSALKKAQSLFSVK